MEPTEPVYDSITSGALRMARRHWYVLAIGAVAGLLAGLFLGGSGASWTADADVRILFESVAPNPRDNPEGPLVDPNAIALRVEQSTDELDLPDDTGVTVVGDSTAGLVQVTATGPSEEAALAALAATTDSTEQTVITELGADTQTQIAALEATSEAASERLEAADARLAALRDAGVEPGPSDPAVLERTAAADALSEARAELQLQRSRLEALSATAVRTGEATTDEVDSSFVVPLALAVLGAGAGFAALLLIQALDGRVRRRIHLEGSVPSVPVLGVLTRSPSDGELSLLGRATDRFVVDNGLQRLLLVPLGGDLPAESTARLRDSTGVELESLDLDAARSRMGEPGTGIVVLVSFGSVTEDSLRAVVAESRTAGTTAIGSVLVGVPARDHAWAAASTA